VNPIDELALRERLHDDLAALPASPAPVQAVLRRGAAKAARRRAAAAAGTALAAAAAVLALQAGGAPARPAPAARFTPAGRPVTGPVPASPAPATAAGVFASGTAGGLPWWLSVGNIADPGARCLPALLLNGTDGDLLPDAAPTPGAIGGLAFLSDVPGRPGAGFAVLRVAAPVTSLTARLASGGTLTARPVTVHACGRSLRLAGFAYPASGMASGVARITAYAGPQAAAAVSPPGGLVRGAAPGGVLSPAARGAAGRTLPPGPGAWQHLWRAGDATPGGLAGAGRAGHTAWRVSVLLGWDGECFTAQVHGGQVTAGGSSCGPITPPPGTVVLHRLPLPAGAGLAVYAALLPPRAASLVATLTGGGNARTAVTAVAGREYAAVAVPAGQALARVTAYDAAGRQLGTAGP
jgi:hypothetical protein